MADNTSQIPLEQKESEVLDLTISYNGNNTTLYSLDTVNRLDWELFMLLASLEEVENYIYLFIVIWDTIPVQDNAEFSKEFMEETNNIIQIIEESNISTNYSKILDGYKDYRYYNQDLSQKIVRDSWVELESCGFKQAFEDQLERCTFLQKKDLRLMVLSRIKSFQKFARPIQEEKKEILAKKLRDDKRLINENESLRNQLAALDNKLKIENESLKNQVANLMKKDSSLSEENESLKNQVTNLMKKDSQQQATVDNKLKDDGQESLLKSLKNQVANLMMKDSQQATVDNKLKDDNQEMEKLLEENESLRSQVANLIKKDSQQQAAFDSKLKDDSQVIEKLLEENKSLRNQVADLMKKSSQQQAAFDNGLKDNENLRNQVADLTKKSSQQQAAFDNGLKDNEILKNQVANLTKKISQYQAAFDNELRDNENLRNQMDDLTKRSSQQQVAFDNKSKDDEQEIESLLKENKSLKNQVANLTKKNSQQKVAFDIESKDDKQEIESLLKENERLKDQVANLTKKKAAFDIGSKDDKQEIESLLKENERLKHQQVHDSTIPYNDIVELQDMISDFTIVQGSDYKINDRNATDLLKTYKCQVDYPSARAKLVLEVVLQRHVITTILDEVQQYLKYARSSGEIDQTLESDIVDATETLIKYTELFRDNREGEDDITAMTPIAIRRHVYLALSCRGFNEHPLIKEITNKLLNEMDRFRQVVDKETNDGLHDQATQIICKVISIFCFRLQAFKSTYQFFQAGQDVDTRFMQGASGRELEVEVCGFPCIHTLDGDQKVIKKAHVITRQKKSNMGDRYIVYSMK